MERCRLVIGPLGGSGRGVPTFFFNSRLAESDVWLVAASPFRGFAYQNKQTATLTEAAFDTIVDIDAWRESVAVLGVRRDAAGVWAPEGAIAWLASLSNGLKDWRPLMYSATGGGARSMAECHFLDDGAIRFLRDGRIFVFPGVEPGAFLYDERGKLIRSWPTEHLGVLDNCPIEPPFSSKLAADFPARSQWLNRHRTVDDALDLADGPAVLVRKSGSDGTTWTLLQFRGDGKTREIALPVRSPSPHAHLNADVRGDRLALLVRDSEYEHWRVLPARIVFARIVR